MRDTRSHGAADAVAVAHIQGLLAFIASEAEAVTEACRHVLPLLTKENAMTTNITAAANAVAAAHIQGLQAFMASEVKERATDAQLEAAAGGGAGEGLQSWYAPPGARTWCYIC